MERSRSYTGDLFVIERVSPAGFMGMRSRSANLHSFSEASPCAGRATTPAVDFLSPHLHHSARSSLSPSPAVGSGSFREHHDTTRTPWRLQQNQNPFYDHPQFRQYRSRQEQKDEKDGQKWPPILENPFLDALLLIPDMGRSKYFMHGSLYGRNMIISNYVWMSYCMSLPARATPNPVNRRDRKAISSHIQVLKNFFKQHRFFHFFFPTKDEEQRRGGKDDNNTVETLSLKTNPVLAALSAGQFPEVRPNYKYFSHLLEQNSTVSVRPKTCWVFVSRQDAGATRKTNDRTEDTLNISQYYPLQKPMENLASQGPNAELPLHEYTNAVSQTYSGPVKEVTKHWETCFPELCKTLNLPEPQHEDSLTILEMSVTLKLHKKHFPSGAELNGLVEMSISQPSLQGHQWKCVTRLARPQELCPENANTYLKHTDAVDVRLTHQAGCGEAEDGCDCMAKPRHDIRMPFPAAEWAGMLTNCASYPEGVPQPNKRRRSSGSRTESGGKGGGPTQRELLAQIGMFQELWSCAAGAGGWTRRAVVLWKFRDVHQYSARKKKWVAEAPTTQWRFLTVNDPTSEYHMKNAYVYTGTAEPGMYASPQPFQEGLAPGDDFMAWNMGASVSNHMRRMSAPTGPFHMEIPEGLTTLSNTYPSSLESSHADLGQQFPLLPSSCSTESQDGSFVEDVAPTELFAGGLGLVSGGLMYEGEDAVLTGWDAELKWAPAEMDGLPGSGVASEWGGKEMWAGEEEWVPPVHQSLRPEWDEVKEKGVKRVLGKRGREGLEGERPARRARTEGMRSVVGRA